MGSSGFLLGFDVGSSSIKAALLNAETGVVTASASFPKTELAIEAKRPGWAEQDPALWWDNLLAAAAAVKAAAGKEYASVSAIGISYQMHGLVIIDKEGKVLRPSIIWCDSRAVDIGEKAFKGIGEKTCLTRLLNSPGNFTASKLAWVRENEPDVFARVKTFLLPRGLGGVSNDGRSVHDSVGPFRGDPVGLHERRKGGCRPGLVQDSP